MTNRVVTTENQLFLVTIIIVDRERTILDIFIFVHFQVILFIPSLQQPAKNQHNDALADDKNTFLPVIPRERSQKTLYSKSDIGTGQ